MTSVSPLELGKRLVELLAIRPGDALDLKQLRGGGILIEKAGAKP